MHNVLLTLYNVLHSSSLLFRWAFWSIHYDIKYGVFYREKEGGKKVPLKATERINAHQVPVDGWVNCEKPGICKYLSFISLYADCNKI